jgi:hypothetical protein
VSDVVTTLIDDAATVEALIPVRDLALGTITDPASKHSACVALASIFRIARQFESARTLYEAAFTSSGGTDLQSLFARAQLLLETGELTEADRLARQIVLAETADYGLKRRAYTLSARIAHEQGRTGDALEMLGTLVSLVDEDPGADLVEVETLFLMREILALTDDERGEADAAELLDRLFPSSIASRIAGGQDRNVVAAGLPSALLLSEPASLGQRYPSAEAPEHEPARRDQPQLSGVQVGSFRDADNAEHLARDLAALGLEARVHVLAREDTTYHQVVVAIPNGSVAAAGKVLTTLSENGYAGFLIY